MKQRLLTFLKWLGASCLVLAAVLAGVVYLALQTSWGARLAMGRAAAYANDMPGMAVSWESLSGTLMNGLSLQGVDVAIEGEDGSATRIAAERLQFTWSPLNLLDSQVKIHSLALRDLNVALRGAENPQPAEPADVGGLLETIYGLPVSFEVDQVALEGFTLAQDGENLLQWQRLEAALGLDQERLQVSDFLLRSSDYEADGRLSMVSESYALDGQLQWRVPAGELQLQGELNLGGSLETLELEHRLSAPLVALSRGSLSPGVLDNADPSFDLDHRVEEASGLVGQDMIDSVSGEISTAGTLAAVDVDGQVSLVVRDMDPFSITLDARYGDGTVALNRLALSNALLALRTSGQVVVQPLDVALDWTLERLDTSAYVQAVTVENLQGGGAVSVATGAGGDMLTQVDLASLSGRLNGQALDASGQVALRGGQVTESKLSLRAGDNTVSLSGSMAPDLDFQWAVDAPALAVLLPALSGGMEGSGTLAGTPARPRVRGSLRGADLGYSLDGQQYSLDGLSLEAIYEQPDNQVILSLDGLNVPAGGQNYQVEAARLQLDGEPAAHTVALGLRAPQGDLNLTLRGGLDAGTWRGTLAQADLQSDYGDLILEAPTEISAGAQAASIGSHCWTWLGQTRLCAEGNWDASQGYGGQLSLADLPLGLLNAQRTTALLDEPALLERVEAKPAGLRSLQETYSAFPPENTFLDGMLSLEASVSGSLEEGAQPMIEAAIRPRDLRLGLVTEVESEEQTLEPEVRIFRFQDMRVDVTGADGGWRSVNSFQVLQDSEDGPGLQGSFESELSLAADNSLGGSASLDFQDIAWVGTLVPVIRETRGQFSASVELGGDLSRPLIMATVDLSDGGFDVPDQGLQIRELNIALRNEGENDYRLTGSAASGEGSLALDSRIASPFQASRSVSLELRGSDFLVAAVPGTRATISPDMAVSFEDGRLDVSGQVEVPLLNLDLNEGNLSVGDGGVGVSRDVVVVQAPPEQQDLLQGNVGEELMQRIPITGDVTLILGEEVRFSGYGLEMELAGELNIEQNPQRPVLVYGEVNIEEGVYRMYGQQLNAEGKLVFFGNPANPALDIRAFRDVRGTVVGVQLSGTIRNMQGELYSTPALPENEVLAMLVTGKSFQNVGQQDGNTLLNAIANLGIKQSSRLTNMVQNKLGLDTLQVTGGDDISDSSLGLGKYITPDLFMRYDVGLFERQSHLTLNYTLTERLNLEVETGVSQSVDLTYKVEK